MSVSRTILHADMDAFYASVEQRDHPEWRGRPVIVGGFLPRQVVSTCSYEARRYGVHSAMPGVRAKTLCPEAIFVAPRMSHYVAVSRQVHDVFARFTDRIEPLSLDEAFLGISGSLALFGGGREIGERIRREVFEATGLKVSVGVASSKFVAKVASDLRKPDALVVVAPGRERQFLAPLPLSRLWGIGAKTLPRLERAGLRTIGDVQRKGRDELRAAFGDHLGEHLHVLANGLDDRPVEGDRMAKSIGHELTFATDLETRDQVCGVLLQLCEAVGRRLRAAGVRGGVVRLKLRHPDFRTLTRQRKIPATDDDLVIYRTARDLLERCWPGSPGVRLIGVTAASLVGVDAAGPTVRQGSLFGDEDRGDGRRERLLRAMDAIRDRHGEDAVHRGGERRSTTPWGPGGE